MNCPSCDAPVTNHSQFCEYCGTLLFPNSADSDATTEAAAGKTVVELCELARPGLMLLSGTVRFASGSTAEWYFDLRGRLGLENLKGDKPTPEDIEAFQIELDNLFGIGDGPLNLKI